MLFWLILSVLTFIAVLCVVVPLSKGTTAVQNRIEFDKAIYAARLKEIKRDLELGRIAPDAAEAAIAAEGRKLIALAGNSDNQDSETRRSPVRYGVLATIVVILIPALSLGAYLSLGNPELPDQSLASRLTVDPEKQSIDELIARAEAHLAANPGDARGWSVIAPVYARIGRLSDSTQAWQTLYRLQPDYPQIRSTLGESMVAMADGVVTENARKLFAEELAIDPGSAKARFYLAMALGQQGDHLRAVDSWNELIEGGSPQAPWMEAALQFRNASLEAAGLPLSDIAPGPTDEDIAAAQDMSEADRTAMIRTMVEGLAEKLKADPADKAGWQRLVQSYIVLGDNDEARGAIERAVSANPDDVEFTSMMLSLKDKIKQ